MELFQFYYIGDPLSIGLLMGDVRNPHFPDSFPFLREYAWVFSVLSSNPGWFCDREGIPYVVANLPFRY